MSDFGALDTLIAGIVTLFVGFIVALVLLAVSNLGYDHFVAVMARERGPGSFDPRAEFGPAETPYVLDATTALRLS